MWFGLILMEAQETEGEKKMVDMELKGKKISLDYNLKNNETYKVNERKGIFTLSIYQKPQVVKGITSFCEDGKHILCLDYDDVCYWIVKQEIKKLSIIHGPIIVLSTKEKRNMGVLVGNYHCYCFKKFFPNEIVKIQRQTSCDSSYSTMPLRNRFRSWVLRLSDKKGSNIPKFKEVVGKNNRLDYEISEAHFKIISKLYPQIKLIDYKTKDGFKKICFNVYETGI